MAAKSILVLCASACLFEVISAQCIGAINGPALAAEELALSGNSLAYGPGLVGYGGSPFYGAAGYGAAGCGLNAVPTCGGGFPVTSSSPISPTGISVASENAFEGPISITGQLPFLGAIALEGALPTAGAGAINYGCGNGAVGIVSESIAPAAYPGAGYGPAGLASGWSYPGLAGSRPYNGFGLGPGLGCGAIY